MNHTLCQFIMGRRMAFALSVVLLGFGGGVLALFVRGMHAERRAVAGSDLFLRRQLEGTVCAKPP
jgi:hypothetical protein